MCGPFEFIIYNTVISMYLQLLTQFITELLIFSDIVDEKACFTLGILINVCNFAESRQKSRYNIRSSFVCAISFLVFYSTFSDFK